MKHQALRPAALMLSFLLPAAVPAKAGTVYFADAVPTLSSERAGRAADVRLRTAPQSGNAVTASQQSGQSNTQVSQQTGTPGAQAGAVMPAPQGDPTLSKSGGNVETIDLGDVTGTVCDCGEIPVAPALVGAGFPMWPFLGLLGVPLAFIPSGDEDVTPPGVQPPSTMPTPTPPATPVPEPATLLLFGTGLLALGGSVRRRYSRGRTTDEPVSAEEVI